MSCTVILANRVTTEYNDNFIDHYNNNIIIVQQY